MNSLTAFEGNILIFIQEHLRSDFLDPIFKGITSLGNAGIIWIIFSILLMIPRKTRWVGISCAFALIFSLLFNNLIIKNLVARVRPYNAIEGLIPIIKKPSEYSFPSGHTASSFAAGFVMLRKLPKRYGIPAIILATFISLSRLYVGVHYPTDVLFGVISGILCAMLAMHVVRRLQKKDIHNI